MCKKAGNKRTSSLVKRSIAILFSGHRGYFVLSTLSFVVSFVNSIYAVFFIIHRIDVPSDMHATIRRLPPVLLSQRKSLSQVVLSRPGWYLCWYSRLLHSWHISRLLLSTGQQQSYSSTNTRQFHKHYSKLFCLTSIQ